MGLLSPAAFLLAVGCESQQASLSQAYRPVGVGVEAAAENVYEWDPFFYHSGKIFPFRDRYWYGRPPFYVQNVSHLQKFEADGAPSPLKVR